MITKEDFKNIACAAIDKVANDLNVISQEIWNNPEEGFKEYHAHKVLTDYLKGHGFSVECHYVTDTGFRATYGGISKPNISVICEYDCLPEIGHACGHNLIAEVGIGASVGIKAALDAGRENGRELGMLTVLGSPAEEGGGGKIDQIRAGTFSNIDVSMMAHPFTRNVADLTTAAKHGVTVRYHGKASHAAQFPWMGVNALDAAVMAYNNVSVMRQQMKPSWRVHGIITKGGVKPNITPEETEMVYFIRTPTKKEIDELIGKMDKCFKGAAEATDCKVDIEWEDKPYDNMISNATLTKLYKANAERVNIVTSAEFESFAGGTDMGNVCHVVPGIHPMFDIGTKEGVHSRPFTAAAGSPEAQPHAIKQAKLLAMTAIDVYCQPELVDVMRSELNDQLAADQQS